MNRFDDRFGRIGYSGIFESDMKVAWSNEKRLFKKISTSHIFMEAYKTAAENHDSFENILTHNGIKFKAVFLPLPDRRYLCIAYPEDRFIRFAYSEMYMRIFNIKSTAEKSVATASVLMEKITGYDVPDEIAKLVEDQIKFSESIVYDSNSIAKIFDADHICEYVNIREKINESYQHIKKYNAVLLRNITFETDIDCSVAKINYSVFESALFEIVRIVYKYIPKGGTGRIVVNGNRNTGLRIYTDVNYNHDFDIKDIDYEIRDIKCAFEFIGGNVSVTVGGNGLSVRAFAPASLSNYNCRVRSYELNDAEEDDPYEILSGYTGLSVEELKRDDNMIQFNCPVVEPVYPISEMLADVMFSSLVSGF